MIFKIQKSETDEPQSQFFQLNQQLFTLLYLHSCNHTQQTPYKILLIVFYLVNFILDNSIVPCGFDYVLRDKLLLLTQYTCHKKNHQAF